MERGVSFLFKHNVFVIMATHWVTVTLPVDQSYRTSTMKGMAECKFIVITQHAINTNHMWLLEQLILTIWFWKPSWRLIDLK